MANHCTYQMHVVGSRGSIQEFLKVIAATYDYQRQQFSYDRHLYAIYRAEPSQIVKVKQGKYSVTINGYCAWSAQSCMLEDGLTYYSQNRAPVPVKYKGKTIYIASKGTSLLKESKALGLTFEVYSSEPGMGFQEHIVVKDGTIIVNECVDYMEVYWDKEEFQSLTALNEAYCTDFKPDEYCEDDGYFYQGGFSEWIYDVYDTTL